MISFGASWALASGESSSNSSSNFMLIPVWYAKNLSTFGALYFYIDEILSYYFCLENMFSTALCL